MAAQVNFSLWFGSFFLRHKPSAQRDLTLPEIREDRFHVKAEFRRKLLACPVDVRDYRVFPHGVKLP
jgi:hypothetical protein